MKPDHTPIPRYKRTGGMTILSQGFRPFFLLAGIWSVMVLPVSLLMILGYLELPILYDPISWHVHEMLFGFVSAAVAGFLLTAIPNWTGRLPLHGGSLLMLVSLWLAGRLAVATSVFLGAWPTAIMDTAFLIVLTAVMGREIVVGRNWRNLPIVGAVGLLAALNGYFHVEAGNGAGAENLAIRLAIIVIIALISLIGGRVVPSFTHNWLAKRNEAVMPASFGRFDIASIAVTVIALLAWAFSAPDRWSAIVLTLAAVMNAVRLARWHGHRTLSDPLVFILHVGFSWIPIGLGMLAASMVFGSIPETGALHALTIGAMGTMVLAVASRATIGHTGRELVAGAGLTAGYILITFAAAARIIAAMDVNFSAPLLFLSAAAWIAAYGLFLFVCGPMLTGKRLPAAA